MTAEGGDAVASSPTARPAAAEPDPEPEPAPAPSRFVLGPSAAEYERQRRVRRPSWRREQPGRRAVAVRGAFTSFAVVLVVVAGFALWQAARQPAAVAAEPPHAPSSAAVDAPPASGPASTGVPAVDQALDGFLKGDSNEAASRLVVRTVACGSLSSSGMPMLPCTPSENVGTTHPVVLSGCTPAWVSSEAAAAEIGAALRSVPALLSAWQTDAGYRAVLSWSDPAQGSLMLTISSQGITSYAFGCAAPVVPVDGRALAIAR